MAEEVGQAFVSILPSLRGFSSSLKAQLRRELVTIDPVVGDAGDRAGRTFGSRMGDGIAGSMGRIGGLLKTGLIAAVAGAGIALGGLTVFGLKSAAALEQTQIGLEALTGSAEVAKSFLGELQQFAAKTPFEFAGVADASRRILAFGAAVGIAREEVIPTLTVIGDLVSVLGGSQENIDSVVRSLGQIASKGKVSQEELLQLAEALPGFNANAAIASQLGLSVADTLDLISSGGLDATTGINALLAGMAQFPGAAGAMEKQAQTLTGVFSTFKDTMAIALTNAFQPVIPEIKQSLSEVTPVLGGVIEKIAPMLGELLTQLLPLVGILSQALTPILGPAIEAFASFIPQLTPALVPLGEALGRVVEAFAPLIPILAQVIEKLVSSGLVPILDTLAPQIADLVVPIGDLLLAMLPLIPPLTDLLVMFLQMQGPLIKLAAIFLSFLAVEALAPALEWVAKGFQKVLDFAKPFLAIATDIDNWPMIFDRFKQVVGDALGAVGQFFSELPGKIGEFLSSLPQRLHDLAQQAFNFMLFAIGFGIGKVIAFFRDLPANIATLATDLWERVKALFTSGVENARSSAVSGFERFVEFVKGLPGKVIDAVQTLPGRLLDFALELGEKALQIGRDIVSGVVNGIKSTIGNVGSALKEGFDSAVAGVKRGLGISSPSKVFAGIGEDSIAGYVKGIEETAAEASLATTVALSPGAVKSPAAAATPMVEVGVVGDGDDIVRAFREFIRVRYGGDPTVAFGTT